MLKKTKQLFHLVKRMQRQLKSYTPHRSPLCWRKLQWKRTTPGNLGSRFVNFYRGTVESILTGTITDTKNGIRMAQYMKDLQRVIKIIQPHQWYWRGAVSLQSPKDTRRQYPPQPRSLFTQLPSGKQRRCVQCSSTRLQSSFFFWAMKLLNSSSTLIHKNSFTTWLFIHSIINFFVSNIMRFHL